MISRAIRQAVLVRANLRCEYCRLAALESALPLQVEHVRPRKHGGDDRFDNLAGACIACNLRKGSNLSGIDPRTGRLTRLFNPRTDIWTDHFARRGRQILGITAIGRTTVQVLAMNAEERLRARPALE